MPKTTHPTDQTISSKNHPRPAHGTKGNDLHVLLLAVSLLLACILVVNGIYLYARMSNHDNDFPNTVLTSKDTARTSAVSVSLSKITENSAMDYAFTLDDSQTMLILTVSITNNSSTSQRLLPVNQFYVRTRTGDYAALHPSMYIKHPLAAATLKPGQTVSGELSFGVPKSASDLYFYADTGWNNQTPVVFNVLK
jgi:hypothetical protein